MGEPTIWRAYSPSRDQVLFTGPEKAHAAGMTAYMNGATHHPHGGPSDWVLQEGTIEWRPAP